MSKNKPKVSTVAKEGRIRRSATRLKKTPFFENYTGTKLVVLLLLLTAVIGGLVFLGQGKNPKSDGEKLAAVELPDDVSVEDRARHYRTVATAHEMEGDYKKALGMYEEIDSLGKLNEDDLYNMAQLHKKLGNEGKYQEYLNRSGKSENQPIPEGAECFEDGQCVQ